MKKLLLACLALTLVLCLLPMEAQAATVESGTCGYNLNWTLDNAGTLTISGAGAMYNYNYSYSSPTGIDHPWGNIADSIKSVVIEKGVTSIGNSAFEDCSSLTSVTIPDSVTSIGDWAFHSCTSLGSVTIGNSVKSIRYGAFSSCDSLQSVTIPDSVTSIGETAFFSCDTLQSVTIGDNVKSIGNEAFGSCGSLTSVTIGDSVMSIGAAAFAFCDSLQSVTVPDSVTSIGEAAFRYCDSLQSVTISDSVTSIGNNAFYSCTSLTDVYYGGTESQWNAISIGSDNEALTDATIHYNHPAHDFTADPTTCGNCGYVRADVAITNVVLRPSCSGLYFKGSFTFGAHETVSRYGIAVSLYNDLPVADGSDETSLYTVGENSVLISNILGEGKTGKDLIYARPYALLEDGTYIYGDVVATNLKAVVETIETQVFDSMTTAQKTAIADMYLQHTAAMQNWLIPKIKEFGEA